MKKSEVKMETENKKKLLKKNDYLLDIILVLLMLKISWHNISDIIQVYHLNDQC